MSYLDEMEEKLKAARRRVRHGAEMRQLKSAAPSLFQIIDGEISMELNRAFGDKPLAYNEYLESHGAVRGIRRIRNLIDSREAEADSSIKEVEEIQKNIKLVKNES